METLFLILVGNGQDEEDYPSVEWPYYLLKQFMLKGLGSLMRHLLMFRIVVNVGVAFCKCLIMQRNTYKSS